MQAPQWLVFGPFRLDRARRTPVAGEDVLPVRPKTLAVLCALVAQAGQLLTKDALFAAVWPETAVSEAVLTVAIRELRRVLGDQARMPAVYRDGARARVSVYCPGHGGGASPERHQTAGPRPSLQTYRSCRATLFVGREAELAQMPSGGRRHARASGR